MGIEPTTYSLGSCRSTTELRPQNHRLSGNAIQHLARFWLANKQRSVAGGLNRVNNSAGFVSRGGEPSACPLGVPRLAVPLGEGGAAAHW